MGEPIFIGDTGHWIVVYKDRHLVSILRGFTTAPIYFGRIIPHRANLVNGGTTQNRWNSRVIKTTW